MKEIIKKCKELSDNDMEIVEIRVPQGLDLTQINKDKKQKLILQTINLFDSLEIKSIAKKSNGIYIESSEEISDYLKENIRKIIEIFCNYTNVNISNLTVTIKKNNYRINDDDNNILAGLLVGLNSYFKTNLKIRELIFLGQQINRIIEYYLVCGFMGIDENNKLHNIGDNPFNSYIVMEHTSEFTEDEITRIKEYLKKYSNINYSFKNNMFFIAYNETMQYSIPISLKKDIKNLKVILFKNVKDHKVLVKYIK